MPCAQRIESIQDNKRIVKNLKQSEDSDRKEPHKHNRSIHFSYRTGSKSLKGKNRNKYYDGNREYPWF